MNVTTLQCTMLICYPWIHSYNTAFQTLGHFTLLHPTCTLAIIMPHLLVGFCSLKGKCLNALPWLPRFLVIWDVPSLPIMTCWQAVRNVYFIKKSSVFWDVTMYSPLKANWGIYCFQLQGWRLRQSRNQPEGFVTDTDVCKEMEAFKGNLASKCLLQLFVLVLCCS